MVGQFEMSPLRSGDGLSATVSRQAAAEHGTDTIDTDNFGTGLWRPLAYTDSIRLFQLSRDAASGLLRFTLSEHRLSERPVYLAVSYCWGRIGNVAIIESQNGHRALRRNQFALLHNLQNRIFNGELHEDTLFWVDAICINQESLTEKSQQVQQIGHTFKQAQTVLIWLGTHQDGGFSCLGSIFDDMATKPSWGRLTTHSYWTRVWIVQEFALAQRIVLFDEAYWIDGSRLLDRIANVPSDEDVKAGRDGNMFFGPARHNESLMGRIMYVRFQKEVHGGFQTDALCSTVARFHGQECSDLRDKVYALLSLCKLTSVQLNVDYAISIADLFWRAVAREYHVKGSFIEIRTMLRALDLKICHLVPPEYESLVTKLCEHEADPSFRATPSAFSGSWDDYVGIELYDDELQDIHFSEPREGQLKVGDTFYNERRVKYTVTKGRTDVSGIRVLHLRSWPFALVFLDLTGSRPSGDEVVNYYAVRGIARPHDQPLLNERENPKYLQIPRISSFKWRLRTYDYGKRTLTLACRDFFLLMVLDHCLSKTQDICLSFGNSYFQQ